MTHQYKTLPVTMKMWMQFYVMPWTSLGVDAVYERHVVDCVQGSGRVEQRQQLEVTAVH